MDIGHLGAPLPADAGGARAPGHQTGRHPHGTFDLVVRPRPVVMAVLLLGVPAALVFLLTLMYEAGSVDPRVGPVAVLAIGWVVVSCRARMVVSDGALWRRTVVTHRVVSLDALESVRVRRARYLEREGTPARMVELRDRYGRTLSWKPCYWSRSRELEAAVLAYVRAHQLWMDDPTSRYLSRVDGADLPAVTVVRALAPGLPPPPAPPAVPMRWSARRLGLMVAAALAFVGLAAGSAVAGPGLLGRARCAIERERWTTDVDVGGAGLDPAAVTEGLAVSLAGEMGTGSLLQGAPAFTPGSPAELRDAAGAFVSGQAVAWGGRGEAMTGFVEVDRYDSEESALRYVAAWGEWRCRSDTTFGVEGVPGAVGLRICDGARNRDHVLFVRGESVVHVMAVVDRSAGPDRARWLAERAAG